MDEHEGLRYLYFDVTHALRTQAWIIEHSGGLGGVKNVDHLESVLGHIQNDGYYPEMADKLTHLVYSVNKNHPFNDGNKPRWPPQTAPLVAGQTAPGRTGWIMTIPG